MPLLPALVFLTTLNPQTVQIAGRQVPAVPSPPAETPSQEFTGWSGWGPLVGKTGVAGLYPIVSEAILKTPLAVDAVDWHVKVAFFSKADTIESDGSGVSRSHRFFFFDPQVNETLSALARLPGEVAAATGGKVRLIVDTTMEDEPARDTFAKNGRPFGPAWREAYFGPRINGGRYEAEDRVYRGPYPSVILLLPGRADYGMAEVNGSPVAMAPAGGGYTDVTLFQAWVATAMARSKALGYGGRLGSEVPWKELASGDPPSTADLERIKAGVGTPGEPLASPFQIQESYLAPGGQVEILTDTERGPVLRLSETGTIRTGGVALPLPDGGLSTESAGVLTFWFRSNSKDPLAVMASDGEKSAAYSIGRDRMSAENGGLAELDVPTDGMWHKVGIDLKKGGLTKVTRLFIGPTPASRNTTKVTLNNPVFDLDDFALEAEGATAILPPPTADVNSPDPESRLLGIGAADAATIARLLGDPDANVRLSAAMQLETKAEAANAPALLAAANGIDPIVARSAVRAYARLDLPEKRGELIKLLKFGVTGMAKSEAAMALAQSKDPKLAGDIMILLANRSLEVRQGAADALAILPGREPGIIRTAFLRQEDPGIKLAVTKATDGSEETQAGKLRWSAVNEPSDLVRLWSAIRLIPSTIPQARTDGYAVVRDESLMVRTLLVEWMGANPNEAHRPSLRLALTDRSPIVRAAAVEALKKQPGGAKDEELKSVANDPDARVRAALGT
ncbi:HEAT repeat domain-containing protein [bacterium]|nr:MAG: HEAT repeat domain-containing protein [bacterium]